MLGTTTKQWENDEGQQGWLGPKNMLKDVLKNIFFLQAIRTSRGNEDTRRMLGDDNNTRKDGGVKKHARGL